MGGTEIKHRELSFRIVGCAMRVHEALGPGFPEAIYHRALVHELLKARIPFESQKSIEVYYDNALCGEFRLDLLVDNSIVIELKALDRIVDDHVSQALSYLKATKLDLAIIMNFGRKTLDAKRVVV